MSNEIQTDLALRGRWTSASNAMADELCPGRHLAQLSIPEPPESDDAKFGTAIHNELAGKDHPPLDTDQESIVESMRTIDNRVLAVFYPNAVGKMDEPLRERRLWIEWPDKLRHSAQVDVGFLVGYRALIGEYKSLPGDVPTSPNNLQLRDQAVLVSVNVPGLTEIGVYVNQPLVTHSPEICIYQVRDLDRARDDLYRRVFASNQKDAQRRAGEEQCKFCRAKVECPAYIKMASSLVATGPIGASLAAPVEKWTPQQRALFLDRAGVAEQWLNDCYERLRELLMKEPDAVPGYTLREGRNNPTLINPQNLLMRFMKLGGTQEQFIKSLDVGKGKLTEAVKEVTKLKGKKLEDTVKGIIGEDVVTTKNRPSIVKKQ